jgi:hypothetical protein
LTLAIIAVVVGYELRFIGLDGVCDFAAEAVACENHLELENDGEYRLDGM